MENRQIGRFVIPGSPFPIFHFFPVRLKASPCSQPW